MVVRSIRITPFVHLANVCLALTLIGCSAPQQTAEPLPPVHPADRASYIKPPPTSHLPQARALINIQQIALPLDLPTDTAWRNVNETAFPQLTRSAWHANGMRLGIITADDLDQLAKALPQAVSIQNKRLLASDHPTPVRRSPPLGGIVTADLTSPPLTGGEESITGGRMQLLAHVDANLMLYLTPHHHQLKASLAPRSALEKELDGRIFRELTLTVALSQREVLVVGLHRPWPTVPQPDADAEPTQQAPPTYDLDHPPPLHNDLGRALLTADPPGGPLQMLLLITVEPLTGRAARPHSAPAS